MQVLVQFLIVLNTHHILLGSEAQRVFLISSDTLSRFTEFKQHILFISMFLGKAMINYAHLFSGKELFPLEILVLRHLAICISHFCISFSISFDPLARVFTILCQTAPLLPSLLYNATCR